MAEPIRQAFEHVLANPKTGPIVAGATAGLGFAEIFDYLKDGFGLVAIIASIYLSVILIKKSKFELNIQRERRAEEMRQRKEEGLPVRRSTDSQ